MFDHNPLITIFDAEYPAEKQAEGLGVSEAVVSGKCDTCKYYPTCTTNEAFAFPVDAACMKIRDRILKEWAG